MYVVSGLTGLCLLQRKWQEEVELDMDEEDMTEEQLLLHKEITKRRKDMVATHRKTKVLHGGNSVMPRSRVNPKNIGDMEEGLEGMGMQSGRAVERVRSASAVRLGRKRQRSVASQRGDVDMAAAAAENEELTKRIHTSRSRSMSRGVDQGQSMTVPCCEVSGVPDAYLTRASLLVHLPLFYSGRFHSSDPVIRLVVYVQTALLHCVY